MPKTLALNFELYKYGLYTRLVQKSDAAFILQLRTNEKLNQHIHATSNDLLQQEQWIENYKIREQAGTEYYFIFEVPKGTPVGVCRLYNITEDSFTSGSWVFSPDAPMGSGVLADIITREIGFDTLQRSINYYDVRKDNRTVNAYHLRYKPTRLDEDEEGNVNYKLGKEAFEKGKQFYLRMTVKTIK